VVGDRVGGFPRPEQRAGHHERRLPRAERRTEVRGLPPSRFVERRVEQTAEHARLVERGLAVPGQVHEGAGICHIGHLANVT